MERIPCKLHLLEIGNFKSYEGSHTIGPLRNVVAIVGPNGSGKSNLMDAISFVMGETAQALRVRRLSDLIHGSSVGRPSGSAAIVRATFRYEDGSEQKFSRKILPDSASSIYKVDGVAVSSADYLAQLEILGVNVRSKNFLVYQGTVESIVTRNPRERAAHFEHVSGSISLKEQYENLQKTMAQVQDEIQLSLQRKKVALDDKRRTLKEKEEADQYESLFNQLKLKKKQLYLFQLYYAEQTLTECGKKLLKKMLDKQSTETRSLQLNDELKSKKLQHSMTTKELFNFEKQIRGMESERKKTQPQLMAAKELVDHSSKKVDSARKSLESAQRAKELQDREIFDLDKQLGDVEKAKREYEAGIQSETLQLREENLMEYNRLKLESSKRFADLVFQLESLHRLQKEDQDRLENDSRSRKELENKLIQRRMDLEVTQKRMINIKNQIQSLKSEQEEVEKLDSLYDSSQDRIDALRGDLEKVIKNLDELQYNKHEDGRSRRKKSVIENLQRRSSGVYDRIVNLCRPIRSDYQLAVTKSLIKFMDAIVVDSLATAQDCINHLKEQKLEPEIFLPLDALQPKPLKERLRTLQGHFHFRLLYDLLEFDPQFERAILYITNNTLVCDTTKDAATVAYEMPGTERYDAVSQDGTLYQKSGIVSGGFKNLAMKAAQWDDKKLRNLQNLKEKLTQELTSAERDAVKLDPTTSEQQLKGLKKRLQLSVNDEIKILKEFEDLQKEIEGLEGQLLEESSPGIAQKVLERSGQIKELERKMEETRDSVFKDFCARIGVPNIQRYEDRQLKDLKEQTGRIAEFGKQMDRIRAQLKFLQDRDMQTNIERWTKAISNEQDRLSKAEESFQTLKEEDDRFLAEMSGIEMERDFKKKELERIDEEMAKIRYESQKVQKEADSCRKSVMELETVMERKKAERHIVLKQAKMEDIVIRRKDDLVSDDEGSDPESQYSNVTVPNTQTIYERENQFVIDYDELDEEFKDLIEDRDVVSKETQLKSLIDQMSKDFKAIKTPNLRAAQKLDLTLDKAYEMNQDYSKTAARSKRAEEAFDAVKKERYDLFMECFQHVSENIDGIYKALTRRSSAWAVLTASNAEEPFDGSVDYCCIIPGKPCRPMTSLSGGEQSLASLALLFAIRSYNPAPFFVLDEVDAALDGSNVAKLASFIRYEQDLQTIFISHKKEFFGHAESLIGICSETEDGCLKSWPILLDLTEYRK